MRIFLSTLLFLLLSIPSWAGDICTGLSGWWTFDEGSGSTAIDSSTFGNNGTESNSPSYVTGEIGPYALSFINANNTYIQINISSASVNVNSFSLSFWMNGPSTTEFWDYIGLSDSTETNELVIENNDSTGTPNLYNISGYSGMGQTNISAPNILDSSWHQVVLTASNAAGFQLYIDGNTVSGGSGSWAPSSSVFYYLTIANRASALGTGRGMTTKMDDVRIYNRVLSASDVTSLYAYTSGSCGSVLQSTIITGASINGATIN